MIQDRGKLFHYFSKSEIAEIQISLLRWYRNNKRALPWRSCQENNQNTYAYHILVSEIMLQQTQVATVIDYFDRWISRWPTMEALGKASLEEVQVAWKGLGYYSRGTRLLSLAQQLPQDKMLPTSSVELMKLPGVGRYTAGAVASIAFGERVPAVDGNAIRVICRLRSINAPADNKYVNGEIWKLADSLVPETNAGDWNQAVMELGATICTPRKPKCDQCPLKAHCHAHQNRVHDLEDCNLCLITKGETYSVLNYPGKKVKKAARDEITVTCIVSLHSDEGQRFFVVKRSSSGLLADLWQFPSFPVDTHSKAQLARSVLKKMRQECNLLGRHKIKQLGQVHHKFSHINMTYSVMQINLAKLVDLIPPSDCCQGAWVTKSEFDELAASTAMRKIFKYYLQSSSKLT